MGQGPRYRSTKVQSVQKDKQRGRMYLFRSSTGTNSQEKFMLSQATRSWRRRLPRRRWMWKQVCSLLRILSKVLTSGSVCIIRSGGNCTDGESTLVWRAGECSSATWCEDILKASASVLG